MLHTNFLPYQISTKKHPNRLQAKAKKEKLTYLRTPPSSNFETPSNIRKSRNLTLSLEAVGRDEAVGAVAAGYGCETAGGVVVAFVVADADGGDCCCCCCCCEEQGEEGELHFWWLGCGVWVGCVVCLLM